MLRKGNIGWVICAVLGAAVCSGCVTGADGESTFAPIAALQQGVDKLGAIPDDTKASVLEAIAMLLGATGVGGGAAILASKGAAYYRNRGKRSAESVSDACVGVEQKSEDMISEEGVRGDVGS